MLYTATPELILQAYHDGIFPMAESAQADGFDFYRPKMRGQLSIENLHIPRRLEKTIRSAPYRVSVDEDFETIITHCAKTQKGRESTWINSAIRDVFIELHQMGYAHSVECWEGEDFAGGLYGLAIGRVFCGESMVSQRRDASKIALAHLCARLWQGGFSVLDTQFINPHLTQFGVYEIKQSAYEKLIKTEISKAADFLLHDKIPVQTEQERVLDYLYFLSR